MFKNKPQGIAFRLSLITCCLMLTQSALAWPSYDGNKAYPGGAKVTHHGVDYQAKWWANEHQAPGTAVENEWDTPWMKISSGTPTPEPVPKPDPEPEPEPGPAPAEGKQYQAGNQYQSGDIVINKGVAYICKSNVAAWCSSPSALHYEPGVGSAWQTAWSLYSGESPEQPDNDNNETGTVELSRATLEKQEAELTAGPMMQAAKNSIRTLDNESVEKIAPGRNSNPENVKLVEQIIDQSWDYFFPHRDPAYTYENFLKAVGKFPALCGNDNSGKGVEATCRKTLATMFAHFTQETGEHDIHSNVSEWQQGLHWVREMGWKEGQPNGYNGECNPATWQGKRWPCGKDAQGNYLSYFGRGAKQLSYNYNYGPFSEAMFGDVRVLLDNPEKVADTWLNLASAVFFYLYPQPPKPSMQAAIDGSWKPNAHDKADGLVPGFGVTTQIINGGVECGGSTENAQSLNRIKYYRAFAEQLGVTVPENEVLGCAAMKQFSEGGAGALPIYWEEDYSYNASNPGGKSYACKLVGYQTPFSALTKGDYVKCVADKFPEAVIR